MICPRPALLAIVALGVVAGCGGAGAGGSADGADVSGSGVSGSGVSGSGASGSGDAAACLSDRTASALNVAGFAVGDVMTTVSMQDGRVLAVIRESVGDDKSLCPDCNDPASRGEGFEWCAECSQHVLSLVDEAGTRLVELDRWWRGSPYHLIAAASAAATPDGRVAVAWRRKVGSTGPADGIFDIVDPAAGSRTGPMQVYDAATGRFRVTPHPETGETLLLRDHTVVLRRVGVHVRVIGPDGAPLTPWQQLGSSLAYEAGAAPIGDGRFAVLFSDQAADEPDPGCAPCDTFETCFGGEGPFEAAACQSSYEATAAGGLQAVLVDGAGAGAPVQIRSGWYDRVYQGEEQTLYADHGHPAVVATPAGFDVLVDYQAETWWLGYDLETVTLSELKLPIDYVETHSSPVEYALAEVAGVSTALLVSWHGTGDEQFTRLHAYWREESCVAGAVLGDWPESSSGFVPRAPGGQPRLEVRTWNETGSAAAAIDVYEVAGP